MFHVLQALSIFVLVNDLYLGDTLEANKYRKYAYSSKTLLINTLNSGRVNPSPAVCIKSFNHIPQSKSMHIRHRGHIETDLSTSSYFVTLSLEYPKGPKSKSMHIMPRGHIKTGPPTSTLSLEYPKGHV